MSILHRIMEARAKGFTGFIHDDGPKLLEGAGPVFLMGSTDARCGPRNDEEFLGIHRGGMIYADVSDRFKYPPTPTATAARRARNQPKLTPSE